MISREKALSLLGFKSMTPVQAATLPHLLSYKDVVVQSKTGSGKTLAFVVPMIEICLQKTDLCMNDVLSIVVSPTR